MIVIYKNHKSEKFSILIDKIGSKTGLFINPECKVIPLDFHLFNEDSIVEDEIVILKKGLITSGQLIRYKQYEADRKEERTEDFIDIVIEYKLQEDGNLNGLLHDLDGIESDNPEKSQLELVKNIREKIEREFTSR